MFSLTFLHGGVLFLYQFLSILGQEEVVCPLDVKCITLRNCPELHPLIKTARDELTEYHCGWDRFDPKTPKVCCPTKDEPVTSAPFMSFHTASWINGATPTPFDSGSRRNTAPSTHSKSGPWTNEPQDTDEYDTKIQDFKDSSCSKNSQCISKSQCEEIHHMKITRQNNIQICGWGDEEMSVKVCCPSNYHKENRFGLDKTQIKSGTCGKQNAGSNRIIGGNDVAVDEYPWLALLQYKFNRLRCAGSVISPRFVLTAAHCLDERVGIPEYVRLSEYNITSYPIDYVQVDGGGYENVTVKIVAIPKIYKHSDYKEKSNDIGLVKMAERVDLTGDFIRAICLPENDFMSEFTVETRFTVAGWGRIDNTYHFSDVKLQVEIPFVPASDRCGNDETIICAGGEEGKDSCTGDSGGPLMYISNDIFYAVGVVSSGPRFCGTKEHPATHTNVYHYLSWIRDVQNGKYD